MFGRRRKDKAARLGAALAELDKLETAPEEAFEKMLEERPPPAAAGVDLAAVTAADASFDGYAFLAIARESYFQYREAEEKHAPEIAADLSTPEVDAELKQTIARDARDGRYHVLAGVEIMHAVITSAAVEGRVITLVVNLQLRAKDTYLNEHAERVEGDDVWDDWSENWTFVRDLDHDESHEDHAHALIPEANGGWDFAHKGWNVAEVARA